MKKVLSVMLVLVGALVVTAAYLLAIFDGAAFSDTVRDELIAATGHEWTIEHDAELRLGLNPTVVLRGLHAPNLEWTQRRSFIDLGRVELESDWWSNIRGSPAIRAIAVSNLEVNLETDGDGANNFAAQASQDSESTKRPDAEVFSTLRRVDLRDTVIRLRLGWAGVENTYPLESIAIRLFGANSPAHLQMIAEFRDRPVAISGELGSPSAMVENQAFKIDLTGHYDGKESDAELGLTGRIDALAGLAGMDLKFTLQADALNDIESISGLQLPRDTRVSISAALVNTGNGPQLDDYIVRIGQAIIRPGDGP